MKIIVAGLCKTGTKSMVQALTELGYNVYDYLENFEYLFKEWEKVMLYGGSGDDFRRMFENVDAVTDVPACYFWEEIHKAFPDAKIILTVRDDVDIWYKSMVAQLEATTAVKFKLMYFLSPHYRKYSRYGLKLWWPTIFGILRLEGLLPRIVMNEMKMKMVYNQHLTNVKVNAPKDKLLVFNVKEGWRPLCKFLDVDIPNTPFPHKNTQSTILDDFVAYSPTFSRIKKESAFFLTAWIAFLSIVVYYFLYF